MSEYESEDTKISMNDVKVNDHIIAETNMYGPVEGVVVGYDSEKFRFRLTDVTYLENGASVPGIRNILNHDVTNVTILKRDTSDDSSDSNSEDVTTTKDYEDIKNLAKSYKLINSYDKVYRNAIDDLKDREYIGFMAEDTYIRINCLHIIAFCTSHNIYFFDILSLGSMPKEIKQILENPDVKKITCETHTLADSLFCHYKVDLKGIFDLQLADNYIEKIKTGDHPKTFLSYEKIINKYLGVPAHIYIKKPKSPHENAVRPLTESFQEQLAKNISFMQILSVRLYNKLMGPLFKAGELRANSLRFLHVYDSMVEAQECKVSEKLITAFDDCEI